MNDSSNGSGVPPDVHDWLSFGMGPELEISGRLIYNGLLEFNQLHNLDKEAELFDFLYNVSIGIERLLKVAIVFAEARSKDLKELEESLITHSLMELYNRCVQNGAIATKACNDSNALLQRLTTFYKTHRYGRFTAEGAKQCTSASKAVVGFLRERNPALLLDSSTGTWNTDQIRRFVGDKIYRVVRPVYSSVAKQCSTQGVYADEFVLRSDKASWVFLGEKKSFDFLAQRVTKKEILLWLMQHGARNEVVEGLLRSEGCLELDPANTPDMIDFILTGNDPRCVAEGVREEYLEHEYSIARVRAVDQIDQVPYQLSQEDVDKHDKWHQVVDPDDEVPF